MFGLSPVVMPSDVFNLESVLRRRGHLPIKLGDIATTLYPSDQWIAPGVLGQFEYVKHFGSDPLGIYLAYFEKKSFRKVVRRLLRDNRQPVLLEELRQIAGTSAEDYMTFLDRLQVLKRDAERAWITREIDNIGPSLEHYVASTCIREFRGSAEWGVTLKDLPRSGGDYDVLAWLDPALVYIECKSAPLERISEDEMREFLQRTQELAPEIAILLVDTDDDLDPLIDSVLNPLLRDVYNIDDDRTFFAPHVDYPDTYFGNRLVFLTNTERGITLQLRRCIQRFYAHIKDASFFGPDPDSPTEFVRRSPRNE